MNSRPRRKGMPKSWAGGGTWSRSWCGLGDSAWFWFYRSSSRSGSWSGYRSWSGSRSISGRVSV